MMETDDRFFFVVAGLKRKKSCIKVSVEADCTALRLRPELVGVRQLSTMYVSSARKTTFYDRN